MSKDIRVTLKIRGINRLMTSQSVVSAVARRAMRIKNAAGDGFQAVIKPGRFYTAAYIQTENDEGRRRQAEDAVLQRSLDAGRG